ncbi:MAG: fumarylacetoacetate hydrolase family protein [Bryobacteraceae bacterium]|jgi:2-dehydro-3-deoxy-D-arabinonate dehydratase
MRLGQLTWNGHTTAAIFNHAAARPIPDYTLFDLICRAEKEGAPLTELADRLAITRAIPAEPMIPLKPREVWACGAAEDSSSGRPVVFLKGTARVCVGPGQPIGIRADSKLTVPEPELAVVLGGRGCVLGYTLANDVSARDLEQESPWFISSYSGSCALGPVMVTTDELTDPNRLMIAWQITRDNGVLLKGEISTAALDLEKLVEYMMRSNPVPAGSILLTGTRIHLPENAALEAGDVVTISMEEIGELVNPAMVIA